MSKQSRRKIHKKYLEDVICDVSQSKSWRKKLFASENYEKFPINFESTSIAEVGSFLYRILLQNVLQYQVEKIPNNEAAGWESSENCVIFKFSAIEFPEVFDYSANNPESL